MLLEAISVEFGLWRGVVALLVTPEVNGRLVSEMETEDAKERYDLTIRRIDKLDVCVAEGLSSPGWRLVGDSRKAPPGLVFETGVTEVRPGWWKATMNFEPRVHGYGASQYAAVLAAANEVVDRRAGDVDG